MNGNPFSPCGRRWPGEARSDEGLIDLSTAGSRSLRRVLRDPSSVVHSDDTFSRKGRRGAEFQTTPSACQLAMASPRARMSPVVVLAILFMAKAMVVRASMSMMTSEPP